MPAKRVLIGYAAADSGLMMIGDPGYYIGKGNDASQKYKSWEAFLKTQNILNGPVNHQMNFKGGYEGLGVVSQTYAGDGTFPVYAKKDAEGRTMELIIKFT